MNALFGIKLLLRGDVHHIRIGNQNIQDGAVIHATYKKAGTVIGNDVSIGHNAIVHGCTLHDRVLIGMGSIVMTIALSTPIALLLLEV